MITEISSKFPLLLPYGLKCLALHLALLLTFRTILPSKKGSDGATTSEDFPWKKSPSLTAHRIVAFFAMVHWCSLGFQHILTYDYNATSATDSESNLAAINFIPAGFEIAQYVMGALLIWDIPSSLVGGSGPTDVLMHVHHAGMVLVTACALGLVRGPPVGTHVAPIFLGVIELSSIPLQIVDLFHPKKSPHWFKYVNDGSLSGFFPKLCSSANEISRIGFAVLFLLVRGVYFPYSIVTIAAPDFYAEGSLSSMILFVLSVLFTLLQLYWAKLVFRQVKKALFGGPNESGKSDTKKDE